MSKDIQCQYLPKQQQKCPLPTLIKKSQFSAAFRMKKLLELEFEPLMKRVNMLLLLQLWRKFDDCKVPGYLQLSSMTRTHLRSNCKRDGERSGQPRNIDVGKLSKETFISWNVGNSVSVPEEF
ncbi:unnamed protein product [Orchesella dallaii]|uniref:Uncharacterized protein n=1 Tax=Orchesella dallaii TaxID=48710 RepID=A0ABP1RPR0_9HEXA